MKILHVYKTFLGDTMGGVEQVIAQLAASSNANIQHTVVSLSTEGYSDTQHASGVRHIRYPQTLSIASNPMSIALWRAFSTLIQPYDVIHYHFPWPFADLMHSAARVNKPCVVTYHSDVVKQKYWLRLYQPLMHHFLARVTRIVATSPQYLATSPVLQQYQHKVSVIPIGLNKQHYPALSSLREQYWRERLGPRFFLFIGVMRYYKGLHCLLEAVRGTTLPVVLVGQGPLEAELRALAVRYQLTQVHFLGEVSDVDKVALLQCCTALIFPSHLRSEAFGVALLEGAMYAKPLISCDIGTGTSFINVDQETGCVIPANNALALRTAMLYLWDNPTQAQQLGLQAEARYRALFTGDKMASAYEDMYCQVMET
jgi:rhamnosyl/mannosyltransferase